MNSHSNSYKQARAADMRPLASESNSHPQKRPQSARPKNLRLSSIRLPLPALVSILHRLSGVLLFLSLPTVVWLFGLSLESAAGYQQALAILDSVPVKLLLMGLIWAFLHHFIAGLRHLALDLHFGLELAQVRFTSKLVLAASLLLTLLAGATLW